MRKDIDHIAGYAIRDDSGGFQTAVSVCIRGEPLLISSLGFALCSGSGQISVITPETGNNGRNEGAPHTRFIAPKGLRRFSGQCIKVVKKNGYAQCAHPGLRIRLYWCRTGPDGGCFRGSGGFSGEEPGSSPTSGTVFPPGWGPFRGLQPVYKTRFMLARRAICG
jgi:hypothetical protein